MWAEKLAEDPMSTDVPVTTAPAAFLMITLRDESALAVPMMFEPIAIVEQPIREAYGKTFSTDTAKSRSKTKSMDKGGGLGSNILIERLI